MNIPIPLPIQAYWSQFEAAAGATVSGRFYEAFHFDDNQPSADALAQLVLDGIKRASAGLLWTYESEGQVPARVGSLSVVTDWAGRPLGIIETIGVEVVPFDQVTAEFAATEGEGDGSLAYWKRVHWDCFERACAAIGKTPTAQMPVVCERFELIYSAPG